MSGRAVEAEPDSFWRWHDRMGIQRPGGPVVKDARYRVDKAGGPLVVVPYVREKARQKMREKAAMYGFPTVIPRTTPRPSSARETPADSLEKLRLQQRSATARLEREWEEFDAGRCALAWRNKTMKRWHRLNVEIIKAEIILKTETPGDQPRRPLVRS